MTTPADVTAARPLDEQYDTMMEVQRDPYGAWSAIQTLAAALTDATQRAEAAHAERDDNYERWNGCQEKRMAAEELYAKALGRANEQEDRAEAADARVAELTAKLEAAGDGCGV